MPIHFAQLRERHVTRNTRATAVFSTRAILSRLAITFAETTGEGKNVPVPVPFLARFIRYSCTRVVRGGLIFDMVGNTRESFHYVISLEILRDSRHVLWDIKFPRASAFSLRKRKWDISKWDSRMKSRRSDCPVNHQTFIEVHTRAMFKFSFLHRDTREE